MTKDDFLIEVKGLKVHFATDEGAIKAADGVDFQVPRGKTVCIVGESGSGKSMTARSLMQLVSPPGRIVDGSIMFHGRDGPSVDIAKLDPKGTEIRKIRGKDIAMIFQEPMSSLSPVHTIGDQITEMIRLHMPMSEAQVRERAIALLGKVGIPKPQERIDAYTFQLSGGMRQRAMIAMALGCEPQLLIADEPTTALDVTTQANILDLFASLQREFGMSMIFITHDLGVVAEIADYVVVMYLGTVAETGEVDAIFHDPKHPYTRALLRSIPKLGVERRHRLESIRGMVPHPFNRPTGCQFNPRCDERMDGICNVISPPREQLAPGRSVRCLLHSAPETAQTHATTPSAG